MTSISPKFLDTNILFYALSDDPRSVVARELLSQPFVISVQALNELANAGRKKLGMSWVDIEEAVQSFINVATAVVALDEKVTKEAIALASRYNFSVYDAVMIAAALRARCDYFCSEDVQHGLVVDGRMTITNPFKAAG